MNKKKTLLTAVFAAVGFFWRPWLGGSFGDISRIWKLIILAGITILMYYTAGHFPVTGKEWAFSLGFIYGSCVSGTTQSAIIFM